DGIRDFHVTGVQTCALPIWPSAFVSSELNVRNWLVPQRPLTPASVLRFLKCLSVKATYCSDIERSMTYAWFTSRVKILVSSVEKIGRASCRERVEMWVVREW